MRQAREAATDLKRECRLTSQLGWHDEGSAFVMENDTIPAGTNLVFEATPTRVYARTRTAGSFDGWKTEVAVPAACSSRFITMCGASLLPALMSVAGKPVGGFGIDLGGPARNGKSTVLKVAKSQSDEPTLDTWGISRAGATSVLLGHTDFPIFLDETAAVRGDGKIISEITDLLSGGRPDTLAPAWVAERDPGRSQGTIRSVLLSTTEGQLAPRRRGQRARLIELPATRPGSFGIIDYPERADPPITNADEAGQLIDRLDKACGRHYGHVLSRFVECMISDSEGLPALIERRVNDFNRATGSAPQDGWTRSVRAWFGLIYAALDLARQWEILPWSEAEILDAVLRCFQDVIQREASSETPVVEIVERIRSWIANAGQTATVGKGFEADQLEDYHVIYDRDGGELVALIQRKRLIPVAGSEAALGRALAKIKEQGMLNPGWSGGEMYRQKRLPGVTSKPRFLFFSAAFAQGDSVKSNQ
jgi:putative DNA primase/helicase